MTLCVLGCKLDDIDAGAATARILEFAKSDARAQVVTLGTEMVVYAQRDAGFRTIVNNAALSLCDTVGLLMVARLRGSRLRRRVTGVELVEHLCAAATENGVGVYLLGGAAGVAQRAGDALIKRHRGIKLCGSRDGYFKDVESPAVAAAIKESGARILLVGLGFPRQETWIAQHLEATGCGSAVGVGGSFDVLSGNVRRAPKAWRRLGVEWLYRLITEPKRWRRQLALPYFVWLVLLEECRRAAFRRTANP